MSNTRVAIIIPAYNEGEVLGKVLEGLPRKRADSSIDILVVNDGSSDNTSAVARNAGVIVIDHVINAGSGGATSTGLIYARRNGYDLVITMDADGQHTSDDCMRIIDELLKGKHDLIIGSRLIDSTGMPWYRVLGNKGLSFITYLMFGLHVTDSQSGLKGFNRTALDRINIKSQGWEFCSEIIWRAHQAKLSVIEIPIRAVYTDYSLKKGQSNWNAINLIKSLIKRRLIELVDA